MFLMFSHQIWLACVSFQLTVSPKGLFVKPLIYCNLRSVCLRSCCLVTSDLKTFHKTRWNVIMYDATLFVVVVEFGLVWLVSFSSGRPVLQSWNVSTVNTLFTLTEVFSNIGITYLYYENRKAFLKLMKLIVGRRRKNQLGKQNFVFYANMITRGRGWQGHGLCLFSQFYLWVHFFLDISTLK